MDIPGKLVKLSGSQREACAMSANYQKTFFTCFCHRGLRVSVVRRGSYAATAENCLVKKVADEITANKVTKEQPHLRRHR